MIYFCTSINTAPSHPLGIQPEVKIITQTLESYVSGAMKNFPPTGNVGTIASFTGMSHRLYADTATSVFQRQIKRTGTQHTLTNVLVRYRYSSAAPVSCASTKSASTNDICVYMTRHSTVQFVTNDSII